MSTYFLFPNRYQPGTKARAEDVNDDFDRVVSGFAAAAADIDGAIANAATALAGITTAVTSAASAVAAAAAATANATAASASAAGAQSTATSAGTAASTALSAANAAASAAATALSLANEALAAAGGAGAGYLPLTGGTLNGSLNVTSEITTQTFTAGGSTSTGNRFFLSANAANEKYWDMISFGDTLRIRAVNDALTMATDAMVISKIGSTVQYVQFPTPVYAGGLTVVNSIGGGFGGAIGLMNTNNSGGQAYLYLTPANDFVATNAGNTAVNLTVVNATGDIAARGRFFGRAQGFGLGRITVQPSAAALPGDAVEGDLVLQY